MINQIKDLQCKKGYNLITTIPQTLANLGLRLKRLNQIINKYGKKYPAVRVVFFTNTDPLIFTEMILTGVTKSEAISVIQYKYPLAKNIEAHDVPLLEPIK